MIHSFCRNSYLDKVYNRKLQMTLSITIYDEVLMMMKGLTMIMFLMYLYIICIFFSSYMIIYF